MAFELEDGGLGSLATRGEPVPDDATLLRVRLPDRPGGLALFASSLAEHGVNIVRLEVVHWHEGAAVDDVLVVGGDLDRALAELPSELEVIARRERGQLPDPGLAMAEACAAVTGDLTDVASGRWKRSPSCRPVSAIAEPVRLPLTNVVPLAAVRLLSRERALGWGALPIGFEGDVPVVAVNDPANRHLFGLIADALGRKPRFVVVTASQLATAIGTAYALSSYPGQDGADDADSFAPVSAAPDEAAAPLSTRTRVLALLANGERVEVASAPDAAGALAQARSFILSLDERRPGEWPLAGGRFLRPDAIVSVDVAESPRG